MKTLLLLIPVLLIAAAGLAQTGQDILIDNTQVYHAFAARDVAAAADGTLFALCHADTGLTYLNLYRSTNGGSTWSLWGELETEYGDGHVDDAQIAVTGGSDENLVVAWVDQRHDVTLSYLRVSVTPITGPAPVWTRTNLYTSSAYNIAIPRLDTAVYVGGLERVCLVWKDATYVMYAGSYDSGATWSGPISLAHLLGTQPIKDVDVSADNGNVVHAVWLTNDLNTEDAVVSYRRATSGGLFPSDWASPQTLLTVVDDGLTKVTVAADPSPGQEVLMATGSSLASSLALQIRKSFDSGLVWNYTTSVAKHYYPDAEWGDAGPFILADTVGTPELNWAWTLLTPQGEEWESSPLVSHLGKGPSGSEPHLALDPSHGDAPLCVGYRAPESPSDGYAFWFNAAWRSDPGFGVPDPYGLYAAGHSITHPVLPGDLDGDGDLELVVSDYSSSTDHRIRFLDLATGDILFTNSEMNPAGDVALLDLDGDGDLEVFWFRAWDGFCEARQGDGSRLSGFPRDLGVGTGPLFVSGARVFGAASQDAVVAGDRTVHLLGPDGLDRPGWPWTAPPAGGQITGRVALGDVDNDGRCDLVVPLANRVAVLDRDGLVIAQFGEGEAAAGAPSLADLDADGDLEIAIPRADGTVHLVHHDGTSVSVNWPFDTGVAGLPSQISLGDLAGDERRDLVFMDADHHVRVITPAGTVVLDWQWDTDPAAPLIEPMVVQLGPGDPGIAVGSSDGTLRVRPVDGPQDGWPRYMGGPIEAPATVADIDGDGMVEMIVPTAQNLWILDMGVSVPADQKLWTVSGADVGRSGSVEPLPTGLSAAPETPTKAVVLRGAYPNPFNPATHIRFHLERDTAQVSLRVYDVAGRLVRTLQEGALPAGEHQILWRGDDAAGRPVASGVYYGRLQAGGVVQTRPMVLTR